MKGLYLGMSAIDLGGFFFITLYLGVKGSGAKSVPASERTRRGGDGEAPVSADEDGVSAASGLPKRVVGLVRILS